MCIRDRLFVLVAIVALLLMVPMPHMMRCDIVVVPESILPVYVEESGVLEECFVSPGDEIVEGQELARLRNYQLEEMLLQAQGTVEVKQAQLREARAQELKGFSSSQAGSLEAEVTEAISLLADLRVRATKLTIRSPISGCLLYTSPSPRDRQKSRMPSSA